MIDDVNWDDWEPLADESDPKDLLDACSFIIAQQPLHANHFVRTIKRDPDNWEIRCACGEVYTVTWKPVSVG